MIPSIIFCMASVFGGVAVHTRNSSLQALDRGVTRSAGGNEGDERGRSRTTGCQARLLRSSSSGHKGMSNRCCTFLPSLLPSSSSRIISMGGPAVTFCSLSFLLRRMFLVCRVVNKVLGPETPIYIYSVTSSPRFLQFFSHSDYPPPPLQSALLLQMLDPSSSASPGWGDGLCSREGECVSLRVDLEVATQDLRVGVKVKASSLEKALLPTGTVRLLELYLRGSVSVRAELRDEFPFVSKVSRRIIHTSKYVSGAGAGRQSRYAASASSSTPQFHKYSTSRVSHSTNCQRTGCRETIDEKV